MPILIKKANNVYSVATVDANTNTVVVTSNTVNAAAVSIVRENDPKK